MAFKDEEQAKAYWAENISLLFKLLAVWFVVSFVFGILLVDVLNEVRFFGFKLGFWFSQQGAIYTFVAVDAMGKPSKVSEVSPETALEKKRFEGALRRRQLSLILAGKLKANDASELKALFSQK